MTADAGGPSRYPRIKTLGGVEALRARIAELDLDLPCDDHARPAPDSPLAQPIDLPGGLRAANRFAIQPMEGWDAEPDGTPSDLVHRRWRRFGTAGAGLVWGGEAVAVVPDGRANPNQLTLAAAGQAPALADLRAALLATAAEAGLPRPVVGLQLTHSGRWAKPGGLALPRVAHRHPLLDGRAGVTSDDAVLSDEELDDLVERFAAAARAAATAGFEFVDLKHCHGYLLHELLAARHRSGRYGGPSLEDRTAFLREVVTAVTDAAPEVVIGVRLSAFDLLPHHAGANGTGEADPAGERYEHGFGVDSKPPHEVDLREAIAVVRLLGELGVGLINITADSPYYCPHAQRPAAFPPSDGYDPPEDPLVGVARLLHAARQIKAAAPGAVVVSSGWSYLQEYVPHVAQACVRDGWFDLIGLGRMTLAYPELPADVLAGRALDDRRVCRTFSDCTTAPRNGLVSGCYPLDPYYQQRPERQALLQVKRAARQARRGP